MRSLLRAAVVAALVLSPLPAQAARCLTAAAKADPVGNTPCEGVRPGATYTVGTAQCSFGFVFQGSDKRRYVATAGHCALAADGTKTWPRNTGPAVTVDGKQAGRFVYATLRGQFEDFALIRLDPGVASSPQMCHFGGPTSLTTEIHNRDVLVHHYGAGFGADYLPARTGDMFYGLYRPDYVYFYGVASTGDSGSPVIDADGAAVGIITDLTTPFTGNVGVNRLAGHLTKAQQALKVRLTLLTAPTL
jgi:hypothetical protein